VDIEYFDRDEPVPMPKRVRYGGTLGKSEFVFSGFKFDTSHSDREFTLPYYGLPDITSRVADPNRTRGILWIGGVGLAVITVVGGICIRRRMHLN
jgi:hypothetical protein